MLKFARIICLIIKNNTRDFFWFVKNLDFFFRYRKNGFHFQGHQNPANSSFLVSGFDILSMWGHCGTTAVSLCMTRRDSPILTKSGYWSEISNFSDGSESILKRCTNRVWFFVGSKKLSSKSRCQYISWKFIYETKNLSKPKNHLFGFKFDYVRLISFGRENVTIRYSLSWISG